MSKPCKECPFSRDFKEKYPPERLVLFLAAICGDEGQICHLTEDRPCVGAELFFEGNRDEVFYSIEEMASVRGDGDLAFQFFNELSRLQNTEIQERGGAR